ncbi:GNAT family N-acetyltransferase [Paenibacillus sp. HJGM_3]|uniref:GNAT family N-acetyltransferase n=1 Tax=Paenibacillus sp. HJGM_3 TaxID=3379816 RepID=UPI00385E9444
MNYYTTSVWQEAVWQQAEPIYNQAFPEHGRKPVAIIRRMFDRGLCQLHIASEPSGRPAAMALSGIDRAAQAVIIDYLAVLPDLRSQGYGTSLLNYIIDWAKKVPGCKGIVVEAEAEPTPANERRIYFWERNGFRLTDYVHHYIWVPEPYRALALSFREEDPLPVDGRLLFRTITRFHQRAYREPHN